jgi:hypothetical protein
LNSVWDDSVRKFARAKLQSAFGLVYSEPTPYYNDSYNFGGQSLTVFVDTCTYMGSPAKAIIRDLDTLIDEYSSGSINLVAFQAGCASLKSDCLGLTNSSPTIIAGSFVMTALASASFWSANASVLDNYTPQALSATDDKILKADASAAGKAVITTAITGAIPIAPVTGHFAGCVGSIYKGVIIGIGQEGTWLDVIGSWFF